MAGRTNGLQISDGVVIPTDDVIHLCRGGSTPMELQSAQPLVAVEHQRTSRAPVPWKTNPPIGALPGSGHTAPQLFSYGYLNEKIL